jgi:excisionase family DNA binding protein
VQMIDERLLTVKEVAESLRVSQETVRRWLRQGRIKGILMGGDRSGYRISLTEVARIRTEGPNPV